MKSNYPLFSKQVYEINIKTFNFFHDIFELVSIDLNYFLIYHN